MTFQPLTFSTAADAVAHCNAVGMEAGAMHTYFGTEYYVHGNGNNNRAWIYPSEAMFLQWANAYFSVDWTEVEDEDCEDEMSLIGTGIHVI